MRSYGTIARAGATTRRALPARAARAGTQLSLAASTLEPSICSIRHVSARRLLTRVADPVARPHGAGGLAYRRFDESRSRGAVCGASAGNPYRCPWPCPASREHVHRVIEGYRISAKRSPVSVRRAGSDPLRMRLQELALTQWWQDLGGPEPSLCKKIRQVRLRKLAAAPDVAEIFVLPGPRVKESPHRAGIERVV